MYSHSINKYPLAERRFIMRRVNLQLWHWPPYASHLAFMLIGIATIQCQGFQEELNIKIPTRSVMLASKFINVRVSESIPQGAKSQLVDTSVNPPCLIHSRPVQIISSGENAVLMMNMSEFDGIRNHLRRTSAKERRLELIPYESHHSNLKTCRHESQISYGL